MITLRRANERDRERCHNGETWLTFSPECRLQEFAHGFGAIEIFKEARLPPGGVTQQLPPGVEIVTYVRSGTLACENPTQGAQLIAAGEFQCATAGGGVLNGVANASASEWAHIFQILLRPSAAELAPGYEQKRFTVANRRGVLCIVASPDGRASSLRVHQDAVVLSTVLRRGQHVVHELSAGRCAWLQIVQGGVHLGAIAMSTGDGAGISGEHAVSLTADEETECLLLDVSQDAESAVYWGHQSSRAEPAAPMPTYASK